MKKALIILGGIIGIGVVCVAVYFAHFFIFVQPELNQESKAWVDSTIPKILTNWNVNEMVNDSSPELMQTTSESDVSKLFSTLSSKLGAFKKYDGSTGEAGVDINNGREMTTAQYVAEADFTEGTANVTIEGIKENGVWKILYFYVSIVGAGQLNTASSSAGTGLSTSK